MSTDALAPCDSPAQAGIKHHNSQPAQPALPWDLAEPILIFITLFLGASGKNVASSTSSQQNQVSPTSCPTTAPIYVGRGWSRTLLHLFYTRLLPTSTSPMVPSFTYETAASANRIDRLSFLYSVYGGDKLWHSCASVSGVLSAGQVQSAVDGAFINGHLQVLDWLVDKHGASKVLGMINTFPTPTEQLIWATHQGKLLALEWWFRAARQLDCESLNRLDMVAVPDHQQRHLSRVLFEVMDFSIRAAGVPMDCVRWWVREYLPHHRNYDGSSNRSEAADLMFSYLLFCIVSNQPLRVDWWVQEDPHLFSLALELDPLQSLDNLTINEQALLDTLLTPRIPLPDASSNSAKTDHSSITYAIDSPHFRPRFKLGLATSLVNRANVFSPVLTWWLTQSTTPFHLPAGTIDSLAETAHSEIDAFDALQTLADASYALDESALAMDLASEMGFGLLCEWWATYRGSGLKYTHRVLERAVEKGMAPVVEFWLVSGLPLKWRGSILDWAGKHWVDGWTEEIRRLWREYGREVMGNVPWGEVMGEGGF